MLSARNVLLAGVLALICPLSLASYYSMLTPQLVPVAEPVQIAQAQPVADLDTANSILYPTCEKGLCGEQVYSFIPYSFGYTVRDSQHGALQNREEVSDGHGAVKGSYSYVDPYGLKRVVEYVADKGGFRAMIKTNEPGTKTSNPADALIMSSASQLIPHDNYLSVENKQPLLAPTAALLGGTKLY